MTKDVPDIETCEEWIQNILNRVKGIDLFTAYNLSVRDFERGYEDRELRKALKNLNMAYEGMKSL